MKLTACRATPEVARPAPMAMAKVNATVERGNGEAWPFGIQMLEKCQTSLQTEIILKQLEILRKVQPKLDCLSDREWLAREIAAQEKDGN